jgi:sec-independent protein translocase protein TatC
VNFLYHPEHLYGGQVNVYLGLSSCRILSFHILWEIWKFISPALYKNEKKNAKAFIFFSSTFLGVLFGYYIGFPCQLTLLLPLKSVI